MDCGFLGPAPNADANTRLDRVPDPFARRLQPNRRLAHAIPALGVGNTWLEQRRKELFGPCPLWNGGAIKVRPRRYEKGCQDTRGPRPSEGFDTSEATRQGA